MRQVLAVPVAGASADSELQRPQWASDLKFMLQRRPTGHAALPTLVARVERRPHAESGLERTNRISIAPSGLTAAGPRMNLAVDLSVAIGTSNSSMTKPAGISAGSLSRGSMAAERDAVQYVQRIRRRSTLDLRHRWRSSSRCLPGGHTLQFELVDLQYCGGTNC